jgi:D-amino-acid dehydrogenase
MLLQPGKGYSITAQNLAIKPHIPTILAEAKVALTPMGDHLRIGGTLELGSTSTTIDQNRMKGIMDSIPKYYHNLNVETPDDSKIWVGYRPCTPDGLPYIGRVPGLKNTIVATGHGMMGMSMGPASGKLVSEIALQNRTSIDISLFKTDRY